MFGIIFLINKFIKFAVVALLFYWCATSLPSVENCDKKKYGKFTKYGTRFKEDIVIIMRT